MRVYTDMTIRRAITVQQKGIGLILTTELLFTSVSIDIKGPPGVNRHKGAPRCQQT